MPGSYPNLDNTDYDHMVAEIEESENQRIVQAMQAFFEFDSQMQVVREQWAAIRANIAAEYRNRLKGCLSPRRL